MIKQFEIEFRGQSAIIFVGGLAGVLERFSSAHQQQVAFLSAWHAMWSTAGPPDVLTHPDNLARHTFHRIEDRNFVPEHPGKLPSYMNKMGAPEHHSVNRFGIEFLHRDPQGGKDLLPRGDGEPGLDNLHKTAAAASTRPLSGANSRTRLDTYGSSTVRSVASTPIRPSFTAAPAGLIAGTTPTNGMLKVVRSSERETTLAVLQATTTILGRAARTSSDTAPMTTAWISSRVLTPYGKC